MKYIGSKNRLAKHIIPFLEPYLHCTELYYEPFVGGCNMIDKIEHPVRFGCDGNKYLIAMWKALQKGWQPPDTITKEQYFWIKQNKDRGYFSDAFLGFVGHNCSFSGDWFAGYAGTNEPKRNRCLEAKNNLLKQVPKIQDVFFDTIDYREINNAKNYLIYTDPPYYQGHIYRGSSYAFNHSEFWDWCRQCAKNNVVFVSDYYAPGDFKLIWEQEVKINAHQTKQKDRIEKLYQIGG